MVAADLGNRTVAQSATGAALKRNIWHPKKVIFAELAPEIYLVRIISYKRDFYLFIYLFFFPFIQFGKVLNNHRCHMDGLKSSGFKNLKTALFKMITDQQHLIALAQRQQGTGRCHSRAPHWKINVGVGRLSWESCQEKLFSKIKYKTMTSLGHEEIKAK